MSSSYRKHLMKKSRNASVQTIFPAKNIVNVPNAISFDHATEEQSIIRGILKVLIYLKYGYLTHHKLREICKFQKSLFRIWKSKVMQPPNLEKFPNAESQIPSACNIFTPPSLQP
ncbi:unnamed protein product [Onchocerca flexuosa]|uniref:Transposase n=1 Tax=Onchocerca flexuosa TaxID=387005 RepID=A0A183HDC4_9BILA|nr:unnamed protein product [Onchocerca flexuosa]